MRLGIDLGGTKITCAILDDSNTIIWRQRVQTPRQDYRAILRSLFGYQRIYLGH